MRRKGFTVLELVVAIAIVMILVCIAMPGYGRNLGRIRLRFVGMTLVADLRQIQGEAVTEGAYQSIVFQTSQNRYYFREGSKSYASPGTIRTERLLSQYGGFPLAVGKRYPISAVFGSENSMLGPVVAMSFNSAGRPAQTGGGHVTLINRYDERVDVIVTPVDGVIRTEWVHWTSDSALDTPSILHIISLFATQRFEE